MIRIAYFTSLNPQQSGCSDHSEELLPFLGRHADVDVVVSGTYTPSNPEIRERFNIVHHEDYLRDPGAWDASLFQVCNNFAQNAYMIPCLRAASGVVFLQDYCLQYLVLGLTLGQGDPGALAEALRPVYGERTNALVRGLMLGYQDPGALTFAHPFLQASRGLIIPSAHLLEIVEKQIPGKPARYISMGLPIAEGDETMLDLRRRYGYRDDEFIIASVSTLAPKKRLEVLLEAVHRVRDRIPNPRILMVGAGSPGARVHQMIRDLGLADIVEMPGRVEAEHYQHLIRLADVAVDMRDMTAAETAHSVLRCLRFGKPVVVSASGTFLELPDDCCPKLAPDEHQPDALGSLLVDFYSHPEKLREMESAALAYGDEYLGLDLQAREFVDFVREVSESTPAPGRVEVLERRTGRARGMLALLYKAARGIQLVRSYGLTDSLRRVRVILQKRFDKEDSGHL